MSIECLLFGTMPGSSLDHSGIRFGLVLLPDQLKLCNFISRPPTHLKLSRLSYYYLRLMSME